MSLVVSEEEHEKKKSRAWEFIAHAEEELEKYNITKDELYLAQSAEKIWGTYNLLIEMLSGIEIREHEVLREKSNNAIGQRKIPRKLFDNAEILHSYFYEGRISPMNIKPRLRGTLILLKKSLRSRWL